jgi:histidinol-phosphate/aromatic aminotransferase/cobyric acid decarboxylase-like protein/GNAT superfamily N-acetyltransferase
MTECITFNHPSAGDTENQHIWDQISILRHTVFAEELHQYEVNSEGRITDPGKHFIACMDGNILAGYISLNPPSSKGYRLSKYFSKEALEQSIFTLCGERLSSTYEVRGLTVHPKYRGRHIARQLMESTLRFILQNNGTDIIGMSHSAVIQIYREVDMTVFEKQAVQYNDIEYYPMHLDVQTAVARYQNRMASDEEEGVCYHGGKSWERSRFDFTVRDSLVIADVLDSPFPPCPEVLQILREQLERCCRESPPTHCEELIETIAEIRGVNAKHVSVSSGSSSLMFSFLPQLLNKDSQVLVLSPMYGEYNHILTHLIGCSITNFTLHRENGFQIDANELVQQARQHDAVIFVNPNSPTGVYCEEMNEIMFRIQDEQESPTRCKMIWVDETYIDYLPNAQSLEAFVQSAPSLIVCKSMSKCYALSGLRVAYAVGQKITELKVFIPPWSVSLPGQLAAIAALKNPSYYREQYDIIHRQRTILNEKLQQQNFSVLPGVANFILTFLPDTTKHTSSSFIEACKEKGVFIRDAQNMGTTLGDNSVRFAIRSSKENERVIECVRQVLSEQ